jgi:hypothetical protein
MGVPVDINQGVTTHPKCNTPSPNQTLNGFDDWISIKYRDRTAEGGSNGSTIEKQPSPPERTIQSVIQDRIILLESIYGTINRLPENAFALPVRAEDMRETLTNMTQPNTGNLSILLLSNQLDESIQELSELRSKVDSSFGGGAADDLISSPQAQREIVPLIDNLILVLEKQK